ncbi:hypothetical protein ACHWQZ_G006794 [Mnemiopsis leidyi]
MLFTLLWALQLPLVQSQLHSGHCPLQIIQGHVRHTCQSVLNTTSTIYECSESPGRYYTAWYGDGGDCYFQGLTDGTCTEREYGFHLCGCQGTEIRDGRCVKEGLFCVHSIISAHHNKYAAVPPEHVCDGQKHCRNNEDEENCQGGLVCSQVLSHSYSDSIRWLPEENICDGVQHCRDNSDEDEIRCGGECEKLLKRLEKHLKYIEVEDRCHVLAVDFMEEYIRWSCNSTTGVTCRYRNITVSLPEVLVCNGCHECDDHTDEYNCTASRDQDDLRRDDLRCPTDSGVFIPLSRDSLCQGIPDGRCRGDLDATLCEDMFQVCPRRDRVSAEHSHFRHLHKHQICDGIPDCQGGVDEKEVCKKRVECAGSSRTFTNLVDYIPEQWLCDGVEDCLDGSDENVTLWTECEDRSGCYTSSSRCDGVIDCRDGSDEQECSLHAGFKCSLGEPKVLHLDLLCDGVKHCLSGIDESHCGPSTRRAEWGYVKDDREQCAELRGVGQRATHKDTHRQGCVGIEVDYLSPELTTEKVHFKFRTDLIRDCTRVFGAEYALLAHLGLCKEKRANKQLLQPAEEVKCSNPDIVHSLKETDQTLQTFTRTSPVGTYHNLVYQCADKRCITAEQVCDLINDCGHWEEEENCVNHYKCSSAPLKFIRHEQVCDGIVDCPDLSDECGIGCKQRTFLSNEQHEFGSAGVETAVTCAGALSVTINLVTFFYLLYQSSSDHFKYPTKTFNLILLKGSALVSVCLGLYLFLLSWHVRTNDNTAPSCYNNGDSWKRSDTCVHLGILSTGALISVTTLSTMSNYIASRYKILNSTPPHIPPNVVGCSPSNAAIVTVILVFLWSFTFACLSHSQMLQDVFAEHVTYDTFPLSNGSKAHVQELVEDYYAGTEQPRTWSTINKLVGDMFVGLHREVLVTYETLYGNTDICTFPLLVDEYRSNRSIYQLIVLVYLTLLQLINTSLFIVSLLSSFSNKVKTDFPHFIVKLSTGLCTFTTTPLLVVSALHNAHVIDIAYYYSTIALFTLTALGLSNVVLLGNLVYRKVLRIRLKNRRYPSVGENIGLYKELDIGQTVGQTLGQTVGQRLGFRVLETCSSEDSTSEYSPKSSRSSLH